MKALYSVLTAVAAATATVPSVAQVPQKSFAEMLGRHSLIPAGKGETAQQVKVREAVAAMVRTDLPHASKMINEALQLAPGDSQLHFLNGFVYHLQARQGEAQKLDLAVEGYRQALRLERSNWIAQEFLGLAYLDQKKYGDARQQFSDVLQMAPDSAISVHGLMTAAYMAGDAAEACAMADRYERAAAPQSAEFVRSSVNVYASCGRFDKAERMQALLAGSADGEYAARSERRLGQWKMQYTQAFKMPAPPPSLARDEAARQPAPPPVATQGAKDARAPAPTDGSPRMVLIDVVLVSMQEIAGTSRGVNLLSALTLQLGSLAGNVPAYSEVRTSNAAGNAAAAVSTAITRAVTVPALSYSLNIANANSAINEVLARPTLAAMEGQPSEFFSGTNLSAGIVSTSTQGGTTVVPVEKRFGIKLGVTPAFLPNGSVQMKVEAQRTALNANTESSRLAYQIETGEISANANVVMRIGETLVLSGMTEKATLKNRDGVPVLQDVPLVQYLFSNQRSNDIQRSVLILITPRVPAYTTVPEGSPEIVFRHFREGDVTMPRWERMDSTGARLRQALEFLYY